MLVQYSHCTECTVQCTVKNAEEEEEEDTGRGLLKPLPYSLLYCTTYTLLTSDRNTSNDSSMLKVAFSKCLLVLLRKLLLNDSFDFNKLQESGSETKYLSHYFIFLNYSVW